MGISRWLRDLVAPTADVERRRAIETTPTVMIGDLVEGVTTRISGVVATLDDRIVRSPLTDRPCVWWSVTIEGGRYRRRRQAGVPFVLSDATGRTAIDPTQVRAMVAATHWSHSEGVRGADAKHRFLLEAARIRDVRMTVWSRPIAPTTFRFAESVIEVGAHLDVIGTGIREPDPDPAHVGLRERPTWLRITGSRQHPVDLFDPIAG